MLFLAQIQNVTISICKNFELNIKFNFTTVYLNKNSRVFKSIKKTHIIYPPELSTPLTREERRVLLYTHHASETNSDGS